MQQTRQLAACLCADSAHHPFVGQDLILTLLVTDEALALAPLGEPAQPLIDRTRPPPKPVHLLARPLGWTGDPDVSPGLEILNVPLTSDSRFLRSQGLF